MVRIQKLAVTHCWKDKKYFCRTSRYASARAWVDSTFTGVDPTFTWVDSTFTGVDPLRTTEPCISAFLHLGRLNIFLGRLKVQLGRLNFHLGRPSQGFQRTYFWMSLPLGRLMLTWGRLKFGSTQVSFGSTLSGFPENCFLEAWGLGRLILCLGRPKYCSSVPFLQKCARWFLDVPGSTQSILGSTQSTLCCNLRLDSSI